jgi:signal transduction histidine kinase
MLVPLLARGRSLGVIGLGAVAPGRYDEDELAFVEDLARRAAMAIDNARLYHEAQQANRLKDEFLTTVSHELRTPLAAIMNWVSTLRQGRLSPERAARALEVVHRAGEAQARLIEDILDASRAVSGKLRLELREVHLADVMQEALDAVRPAAEAKGITIVPPVYASLGPVAGDPARLQQVVWNLLANAVKFTPSGGRVAMRLERAPVEARIVVTDTGVGIEPAFLPYVFERFSQAGRADSRRHAGLGLGLAIVKYLVEAHGGRVEARSAGRDTGAEFVIGLPLAPASPPVRVTSSDAATA